MLVIIGLIVAGILVGSDMINAAAVRMQIAQIEKYNSAVHAFQSKYGGLPGDLDYRDANSYGFNVTNCGAANMGLPGMRDGNGLLDGYYPYQFAQTGGEVELFWQDLSQANLIDATITGNGLTAANCHSTLAVSGDMSGIYPVAKIGYGAYIYVYEYNANNWFGVSSVTSTDGTDGMYSSPKLPVLVAYNLNNKIDDGIPTTGRIQAIYMNGENVRLPTTTTTSGGNRSRRTHADCAD